MTERILLFVWKQGNPEQDKIQKYMPITRWKFKNLFLYTHKDNWGNDMIYAQLYKGEKCRFT